MSESAKKQNFLQGAALLAIATAIVKIIGALYKLPLNMAIGAEGYSYFTTAYDIYAVLLLVSTAGLPVAVSRMVSEASTLDQYTRLRKIFRTALVIFTVLGAISSVLMIGGAKYLANLMNQPDAWISIACLGPCGILMCLTSAYRGYFNGQGNMLPSSISQVIEAMFKMVVGLVAAVVILQLGGTVPTAAAAAILGVTLSCLVSVIYLYSVFHKQAEPEFLFLRYRLKRVRTSSSELCVLLQTCF
jgi:stage V sporulation protein B